MSIQRGQWENQTFLSTLSLRRATNVELHDWPPIRISIHALLAESDEHAYQLVLWVLRFLSTLSLRRATLVNKLFEYIQADFYPRSPCGERPTKKVSSTRLYVFLSTLSLRRATRGSVARGVMAIYFYPRSPCGERHRKFVVPGVHAGISIHALLAESDCLCRLRRPVHQISIHALLAESDLRIRVVPKRPSIFLSTLSLRRATCGHCGRVCAAVISIHALLAESDGASRLRKFAAPDFYPRSPCGERLLISFKLLDRAVISIHALLAESDRCRMACGSIPANFYPRSPCGERHCLPVCIR